MTENGIRPYGPGKFNTMLDQYVYQVSLQGGADDELGSVSENGYWYGLMKNGRTIFQDHDPFLEPLTEEEKTLLTESAGVIITENDQGFVYVEYFKTTEELTQAWISIEEELEGMNDEN